MSEEEKKAIDDLKKTIEYYNKRFKENKKITSVLVDNFDVNNLFVLLNLIEKQQKELEELKDKNKTLESLLQGNLYEMYKYYKDLSSKYQGSCISKQKIKDKIDEYKNILKKCNNKKDLNRIKNLNERILAYKELL